MRNLEPAWEGYEGTHPIVVRDMLDDDPHPLTAGSAAQLEHCGHQLAWDKRGAIRCWGPNVFAIRVHPSSVQRALRIVDALVKACELRGFTLRASPNAQPYTGVSIFVGDEHFTLVLSERMAQSRYRPTKKELARQERGEYVSMPAYTYRATGQFSLQSDRHSHERCNAAWKDYPGKPLEKQLNAIMLGLRRLAANRIAAREASAEYDRKMVELERRRVELRQQVAEERRDVEELLAEAEDWQQAQNLRAYIAAVEAPPVKRKERKQRAAWVAWAYEQADRLDPLMESPPSILDTPKRQYRELRFHEALNEDGEIELA